MKINMALYPNPPPLSLYNWTKDTDGNGATIRTLLFYYRKALDLIDHNILIQKLRFLSLPVSIINWIINFLGDRYQSQTCWEGCVSEWALVPSGVPRGTKVDLAPLQVIHYCHQWLSSSWRWSMEICRRHYRLRSCRERSKKPRSVITELRSGLNEEK